LRIIKEAFSEGGDNGAQTVPLTSSRSGCSEGIRNRQRQTEKKIEMEILLMKAKWECIFQIQPSYGEVACPSLASTAYLRSRM
jgi:hypothetical protein